MKQHLLLWPMFAQILLTQLIYLRLAVVKRREIAAGNVDLKKVRLHAQHWPDSVIQINNNLRNQFETPVLFYALCMMLLSMGANDISVMGTACVYVGSRYAHAFVHTTSNNVTYRFPLFTLGVLALIGLMALTVRPLLALS